MLPSVPTPAPLCREEPIHMDVAIWFFFFLLFFFRKVRLRYPGNHEGTHGVTPRIWYIRWGFRRVPMCVNNTYTVHNGTCPAFAQSSTRGHALTFFSRGSSYLCALQKKEAIRCHAPIGCKTHPRTTLTFCTPTPLSTSTTRRPMSQICKNP